MIQSCESKSSGKKPPEVIKIPFSGLFQGEEPKILYALAENKAKQGQKSGFLLAAILM